MNRKLVMLIDDLKERIELEEEYMSFELWDDSHHNSLGRVEAYEDVIMELKQILGNINEQE